MASAAQQLGLGFKITDGLSITMGHRKAHLSLPLFEITANHVQFYKLQSWPLLKMFLFSAELLL